MARARLTFRQRDVTAAIKAAQAAGHTVYGLWIGQDGSIHLELTPPVIPKETPIYNPWDEVYTEDAPKVGRRPSARERKRIAVAARTR